MAELPVCANVIKLLLFWTIDVHHPWGIGQWHILIHWYIDTLELGHDACKDGTGIWTYVKKKGCRWLSKTGSDSNGWLTDRSAWYKISLLTKCTQDIEDERTKAETEAGRQKSMANSTKRGAQQAGKSPKEADRGCWNAAAGKHNSRSGREWVEVCRYIQYTAGVMRGWGTGVGVRWSGDVWQATGRIQTDTVTLYDFLRLSWAQLETTTSSTFVYLLVTVHCVHCMVPRVKVTNVELESAA